MYRSTAASFAADIEARDLGDACAHRLLRATGDHDLHLGVCSEVQEPIGVMVVAAA